MFFFHVAIDLFVSIKTRLDFATSADSKISGFTRPHGSKLFADSKISTLESGFKKLQIQKYPDTCGRGLNLRKLFFGGGGGGSN